MTFILRRLGFYAVAAWAALTINFLLTHLLPSNPVQVMMARHPEFPPSARRALEIQYGLGKQGSLLHQYWVYLDHTFHGNLGISFISQTKVSSVIRSALPIDAEIIILSQIMAFAAAWPRTHS